MVGYLADKERISINDNKIIFVVITKRILIAPGHGKVYYRLRHYHVYVRLITNMFIDVGLVAIILLIIFYRIVLCLYNLFSFEMICNSERSKCCVYYFSLHSPSRFIRILEMVILDLTCQLKHFKFFSYIVHNA